ncbi:MAG: helix-turn-helix domain-containing protein [Prevotella sp.]|nr:helix-turn-helix domain-containing protein [Prevotella sp.]
MEDINSLKIFLAKKKRTNKWLAGQLGINPTTVLKWCTNTSQPNLRKLTQIVNLLEVDISYLLWPTK